MKSVYRNVPVRKDTFERLKAYKMADATYDQVINQLMDALPLEEVAGWVLREHRRRMKDLRGRDWKEVRKSLGDD